MKRKILLLTTLLFLATTMLLAQQLEFQELTPARKRPKEIKKNNITMIIAPYGDDLLCSVIIPKLPRALEKMMVLDKQLNVVKEITLPEQYKKYSYTYLCKVGNRYIISIYKGFKDRLLGLLDENLQLIKTYQLAHDYVYERELYNAGDYVILNVNGLELIKVDEELNVLQSGRLNQRMFLYNVEWTSRKLNNGYIAIEKPKSHLVCLINPETLETVCDVELPNPVPHDGRFYSTRPGYAHILYGDKEWGGICSYTYNREVWKDLVWTHEDFPGDWIYAVSLYGNNGEKLQEVTLQAEEENFKSCVEQYCDAIWDEHNNQMIVARAWQNYSIVKGSKTTIKTVEGPGKLTLYTMDRNTKETKHIENLGIDFPVSSVKILNTDENNVYVLLGGQNIMSLVSVNRKTLAYEQLLTKQIEGTLVGHLGMHTNDAGYCVVSNNIQRNTKKIGTSIYYDCESTVLFISKDMKIVQPYHSIYLTEENTVSSSISKQLSRPNMFVIQHETPEGKIISGKILQYDVIDGMGNKQEVPTHLRFFRGITKPVQISPNEYYLLYDYETKTFKLCKLTLSE